MIAFEHGLAVVVRHGRLSTMRIRKREVEAAKIELTSMIDIVFLLLVFFVMTFRVVAVEGDFQIKAPLVAAEIRANNPLPPLPISVRLQARPDGELVGIRMGEREVADFDALQAHVIEMVSGAAAEASSEGPEVVFDCEYGLKYEYVIAAVTAVTGYVDDEGRIVPLIRNVRFASPR
jgi:biopolymer transport protein ExbD